MEGLRLTLPESGYRAEEHEAETCSPVVPERVPPLVLLSYTCGRYRVGPGYSLPHP
jgi:hypothetical protein